MLEIDTVDKNKNKNVLPYEVLIAYVRIFVSKNIRARNKMEI